MEVDDAVSEDNGERTSGSAERLQRSLKALLERRGVMQDLRAHLRSHLVALVRNAQTGEPLLCKELLTQRLERKFQALNILITEYLLREDFNYTLSVFVSELPLANMVFHYAKTLLEKTEQQESADFRFDEDDIWHVLHTLGVHCDSEHAGRIVETYQSSPQHPPLLMCILQSIQLYRAPEKQGGDKEISRDPKSINATNIINTACTHGDFCESCQNKRILEKDSLARKKKHFAQDLSYYYALVQDSEGPELEHDANMEKDSVDEMFEQLKSVYEAETDMLRRGQDKKLQQALDSYQEQLETRERELEEEYTVRIGAREEEMEERKQFLWQLARRLRQQHFELTDAMHKVNLEKRQLQLREENLKEQLKNAEDILKTNGDEMRDQLTQELKVLEQHIDAMKTERNNISHERNQLEKLKMNVPNQSDEVKTEFEEQKRKNADLQMHYDILRDELSIVQKYIAAAKLLEPKSVVESSSLTNICGINNNFSIILNNELEEDNSKMLTSSMLIESKSSSSTINEIKDIPMNNSSNGKSMDKNQFINDLKKFKNVNFRSDAIVQVNLEAHTAIPEWIINSDTKPGAEKTDRLFQDLLSRLREDNVVLRNFTVQQQDYIRELSSEHTRLRAELASAQHTIDNMTRLSAITAPVRSPRTTPLRTAEHGVAQAVWGKRTGGGETGVASPTPRAARGGAAFFKPVLRQNASNDADDRRAILSKSWRSLNQSSPRFSRSRPIATRPIHTVDSTSRNDVPRRPKSPTRPNIFSSQINSDIAKNEETVLHNTNYREQEPPASREVDSNVTSDEEGDVSPTTDILTAAKTRLRKLEIEAEVVEQSYLDFKRRRAADMSKSAYSATDGRTKDKLDHLASGHQITQSVDFHISSLRCKKNEPHSRNITYEDASKIIPVSRKDELTKYLSDYKKLQNKIHCRPTISHNHISNIGKTLHDLPNATQRTTYEQGVNNYIKDKINLVEKPLTEFRKLYHDDNKITSTTHIHRALQELRCKEPKEKKDKVHSPTYFVLRSKAKDNVKDGQAPVSPLTSRQYYNSNDRPTRRLTEEQLERLKNNIQKMYSMKEASREEISGKLHIFSNKDTDATKENVCILNKDIESTEKGNTNINQNISQSQPQKTMNDFEKSITRYEEETIHDLKEAKVSNLTDIFAKDVEENIAEIITRNIQEDVQDAISYDHQEIIITHTVQETIASHVQEIMAQDVQKIITIDFQEIISEDVTPQNSTVKDVQQVAAQDVQETIPRSNQDDLVQDAQETVDKNDHETVVKKIQESTIQADRDILVEAAREVMASSEEIISHGVREHIQDAISNNQEIIITHDVQETIASHVQEITAQDVEKIIAINFQDIISDDVTPQNSTVKDVQQTAAPTVKDVQQTAAQDVQETIAQSNLDHIVQDSQETVHKNVQETLFKHFQESTTEYVKGIIDSFQDTTAKTVHEIITKYNLASMDIINKDFQETKGSNISDIEKQVFHKGGFEKDITNPGIVDVPTLEVEQEYINRAFSDADSDGKSNDSPISFAKSEKDDSFWG